MKINLSEITRHPALPGILTVIFAVSITVFAADPQTTTRLKTEHFDRDPGWDGARNRVQRESKRVARHDFGYQTSNHAGEKAGEMGGVVWRSIEPAYYGKKIKPLSIHDAMSCSGTLSLVQTHKGIMGFQTGATIFVGFFNHQEQGWRPINFVGFRLEGYNQPDGALLEVSYGTSRWRRAARLSIRQATRRRSSSGIWIRTNSGGLRRMQRNINGSFVTIPRARMETGR